MLLAVAKRIFANDTMICGGNDGFDVSTPAETGHHLIHPEILPFWIRTTAVYPGWLNNCCLSSLGVHG